MQSKSPQLGRRTFNALALAAAPVALISACALRDQLARFARDLARSYEQQLIGVDMEDVNAMFDGMRSPVLGVGISDGGGRAVEAARAAVVAAGRIGRHTLIVMAAAPGEARLREYKDAYNTVRAHAQPDSSLIYAPCDDPAMPAGLLRVALLTG